jgi:5-carboxyvanillate decarboxylase
MPPRSVLPAVTLENVTYIRIATEEAFGTAEIFDRYKKLLAEGTHGDPGFASLSGFYLGSPNHRVQAITARLLDLGEQRLRDMDETGISRQILSLTSPGVQVFDKDTAVALARSSNDRLAEAIRKHPDRFSGLTAVAPQDPEAAAKELERGVKMLGLKGAIINSHTRGEYLDDSKFWPIFEAAEALNVPIYLHPNTPSPQMIRPFLERGLESAIFGFAVETGLHLLRIVVSGAFDRFPNLRIVVGHLGEGLPYWLFRIDFMYQRMASSERYPGAPKLARKPSEYLKDNVWVTTSGMAWAPPILYAQQVLGVDRVLYAMDYPYQFVPEEVKVTDELPISDDDKKALYRSNAEGVFGL